MSRFSCTILLFLAPAWPAFGCSECVDGALYGYVPFAPLIPFVFLGWYVLFGIAYLAVRGDLSHHSPARPHKGFFWHCLVAMAVALLCGVYMTFFAPVVLFSLIWVLRLLQGTRAFYHHSRKHGVWPERILGAVDAAALVAVAAVVGWSYATAFSVEGMVDLLGRNHRAALSWEVMPRLVEAGPAAVAPVIARLDALASEGNFTLAPLFVDVLAASKTPEAAAYFPVLITRLQSTGFTIADKEFFPFLTASYLRCAGKDAIPQLQKIYERIPWEHAAEKSALLETLVSTGDRSAVLFVLDRMTLWLEHGGNSMALDALIFERDPAMLSQIPLPSLRVTRHEGFYVPWTERFKAYEALIQRTPAGPEVMRTTWAEKKGDIRQRWERALTPAPDRSR